MYHQYFAKEFQILHPKVRKENDACISSVLRLMLLGQVVLRWTVLGRTNTRTGANIDNTRIDTRIIDNDEPGAVKG